MTHLHVVTAQRAWVYILACQRCGTQFPVTVHENATITEVMEHDPGALHACPGVLT